MGFITRIRAFFAAIIAFFAALFGMNTPVKPDPPVDPVDPPVNYEAFSDAEYFSDYFSPVLRFAVATDTHIGDGTSAYQVEKLRKFYNAVYAYAAKQENTALDAILFSGDCTNRGSTPALEMFFEIADEYSRPGTQIRAVMGNHEFYDDRWTAVDRFLAASGYSSADHDLVIGGYHFLLLSPSPDAGVHYNADKQEWLDEKLAIAVAADPTGKKPIFVVQHVPPVGTVYTADEEEGTHSLDRILKKYPQVIDISGHTHSPHNDPRSIWQGEYTAVNVGSMAYYGGGLAGICDKYVYPTDKHGGNNAFIPGRVASYDAAECLIFEVDARNAIRITGLDVESEQVNCEFLLRSVGDPSKFIYTENRTDKTAVPSFGVGSSIAARRITPSRIDLAVPQADQGVYVQHYRFELFDNNGNKLDTAYALSDRFYTPVPSVLYAHFSGLEPDADYTVKCFAVSSFAVESAPLSFRFTTPADSIPVMREMPVTPDVFSLVNHTTGESFDGVSGAKLEECGFVERNGQAALFDGKTYLKFNGFSSFYPQLQNGFTMEFYGSFSSFENEEGYINMFANFEGGGIGYQCGPDGGIYFAAMFNSSYFRTDKVQLRLNEDVHLVGTYDGDTLRYWANGNLISGYSVGAGLSFPANETAQYLCVGGDSNTSGTANGKFSGTIKGANVYSYALSEDEINALYAFYSE